MKRKLTIMTICAVGVGSSLMLKYNVREILDKHKIEAELTNADMTTAKGQEADIVIIAPDLLHAIEGAKNLKKIVVLDNIVSKRELEEKLVPVCYEMLSRVD